METMSVAKALKELKLLKKRITTALRTEEISFNARGEYRPVFVTLQQANKPIYGKTGAAEFINAAKEKLQSILDMIERYKKIKAAVIQSNAVTMVTVGTKTMSVAQAIEYKGSIEYEETLFNVISREVIAANEKLADKNEHVTQLAENHVIGLFGDSKDNKGKVSQSDIDTARDTFMKAHQWHLIDPINAEEFVAKIRDELDGFQSNIDDIINTSNVRTEIAI